MKRLSFKHGAREIEAGAELILAGSIRVVDGAVEIIGATTEELFVQLGKLSAWARTKRARATH